MKKIDEIVNEYIKQNHLEEEYIFSQVLDIWQKQFPKNITSNVRVVSLKSGVIEFYTVSSAWKKEMLLRKTEIINKINMCLGNDYIININI